MSARFATPDPEWFARVRVGDVLQRGMNGPYRIVRKVSRSRRIYRRTVDRSDNAPLRSVVFAIRRRSWTNRCYTVLNASDLKTMGYRYVGASVALASDLDQCIAEAIKQPGGRPYILYAKHVRGVA